MPSAASQVTGSPFRFSAPRGASQLFLLLCGYAVLDGAAMPVIGDPETVNDTFIEQIVSSASAAIDAAVATGAVDRERVGIGGHSYGAFGLVNPAFAMGNAIRKFSQITVPREPKTTFSVGVVGGGTSVNSIPFETWMEVDMRSVSPKELATLHATFKRLIQEAVDEENAARSTARRDTHYCSSTGAPGRTSR